MGDTIEDEFQAAIKCENLAEAVYREFMKKFAHVPEIVEFWEDMASDEADHAKYLEEVRESLTHEERSRPADPKLMQELGEILELRLEDVTGKVKTLNDAFNFASELEDSEVNAAFRVLMRDFVNKRERRVFLQGIIDVHLARLMDFSKNYGDFNWRNSIAAK